MTKDVLSAGSTQWAQGGLAAVLDPTDTIDDHVADTIAAGAGLCDEAAVRELVADAPTSIRYLMRLGAAFDPPPGVERASVLARAAPADGGGCRQRTEWFPTGSVPRLGCDFWDRLPGVGAGARRWPWSARELEPH